MMRISAEAIDRRDVELWADRLGLGNMWRELVSRLE